MVYSNDYIIKPLDEKNVNRTFEKKSESVSSLEYLDHIVIRTFGSYRD